MNLDNCSDACLQVVSFWLLCVEDFDGMQPSWHLHQRSVQEVALEFLSFQSGTHDHELQVLPLFEDLQEIMQTLNV